MRADGLGTGSTLVRGLAVALTVFAAACAARTAPPLPAALAYPDFVFPAVPPTLARNAGAAGVDRGWRYLQNDDLRDADREFAAALQRSPALYPAQTGLGYVALARRDHDRALAGFAAALRLSTAYVPALVGRGQSLLALGRESEALAAFEAALEADGSLADVRRRVDVLRFRGLQSVIESARAAAAAGRLDEARLAYGRALAASPESAFLHRELGEVERRRGATPEALEHFRRAAALDSSDAASLVQIGELLEQQQDFEGAAAAYRQAAVIEPSAELSRRIAGVVERTRDARLPAEFQAIARSPQMTRGELAALIAIRLEPVVRAASPREVVVTDTRGHWAEPWIVQVARAGVIDPFENHTFQPRTPLRRADLAAAVSRLVAVMAAGNPALRAYLTERPRMADIGSGHLDYPAASVAVASGVLPLLEGDRFQVGRAVTGAEAIDAIARLQALAVR
ncbi:MAG: S-layer homology domain-containing protein [Acidobacteria bacterium]|nr:S-layer homology domain-containing protein [Acidobacteriota bacterium]